VLCLPVGGGVAEDGGQEGVPAEPVHRRGTMGDHGGGTRNVTEQGNLSHPVAASAPAQEAPILLGVKLGNRRPPVPLNRRSKRRQGAPQGHMC